MKSAAVFCTLVISLVADELVPYAPSGWKPDGPAFPLPSFETSVQSNQAQQLPHQKYGIPFSPSRNTEPPNNLGSFQQSKQLTYKEYIERESNKNTGLQQRLPTQYLAQHFDNNRNINKQANQFSYQQQLGNLNNYQQLPGTYTNQQFLPEEQVATNDYLPSFVPSFDVRMNTPVTRNLQSQNNPQAQNQIQPNQQYVPIGQQTNRNQQPRETSDLFIKHESTQTNLKNRQLEESRGRKQIPDQYLPVYDPNITHIEEKGNKDSGAQIRYSPNFRSQNNGKRLNLEATDKPIQTTYQYDGAYRTIVLNNDDKDNIDGAFGRRISQIRPSKTRRAKIRKHLPTNEINIETEEPNISVSTAVANGYGLENGLRRVV